MHFRASGLYLSPIERRAFDRAGCEYLALACVWFRLYNSKESTDAARRTNID